MLNVQKNRRRWVRPSSMLESTVPSIASSMLGFASVGRDRNRSRGDRSRGSRTGNSASSPARGQQRNATPPDCICTKAIDNVTADRVAGNRRDCTRVCLLKRMRDVNSATDETITRWPRANRSGTHFNTQLIFEKSQYTTNCEKSPYTTDVWKNSVIVSDKFLKKHNTQLSFKELNTQLIFGPKPGKTQYTSTIQKKSQYTTKSKHT